MEHTRATLQRIAVHVLARRRHQVTGRFGLRSSPAGLATPAFGPEPEVVRISGAVLVREVGGDARLWNISGATLRELSGAVGADLDAELSVGGDTPPVGDPDEPLALDAAAVRDLGSWWSLGWSVLDDVLADRPGATPATTQLWPEHFDAATTATVTGGAKVNLGFSPGDGYLDEPYCYVGPWNAERPGDDGYWNAPFGAVLPRAAIAGDVAGGCRRFIATGLDHLSRGDQR